MKKILGLFLASGLIAGLLSTTSCSDDPPIKPKLSFAQATYTVNEADEIIEIEVVLDRPALEKMTIDYELAGTAQDAETESSNTDPADYVIVEDDNDYGEIEIDKGETSGIIQIELYSDVEFEDEETIEIKIIEVDSDQIEITRDDETEVTVQQEDGLVILLEWEQATVDLDLLVRFGSNTTNWQGIVTGSLYGRPELAFLPKVANDGFYGLSYTYYEGTVNPLTFDVSFIEFANGDVEPEANWLTYSASYSLANINKWTDVNSTQVVQSFQKSGNNWSNFTGITVPTNGSRLDFQQIPNSPIKLDGIKSRLKLRN